MMGARSVAVLAAAGLAAHACGQIITTPGITASLDLAWQEDPVFPHNDNGLLEPGEGALILTSISFTGQYTMVHFAPSLGPFTDGIITGLGLAYIDIRSNSGDPSGLYNGGITSPTSTSVGPNADGAGTSGYGVRGDWRNYGDFQNGQPVANGFANVAPYQLPIDPSVANQANPISNIARLGWQPGSYAQRTQTFTVAGAAGTNNNVISLYLDLDGGTTGGAACLPTWEVTFGSVNIPIVPAPAVLAPLGVAALAAARRRSRRTLDVRAECRS